MLLAIDLGNTNTVWGIFAEGVIKNYWRTSTHKRETADELSLKVLGFFNREGIETCAVSSVVISSVVPSLDNSYRQMVCQLFGQDPMMIGYGVDLGITVKTDYPEEVGADRLVNAVACYTLYGGPRIIVDFGTATTFCAISEKGEYLGGVIAPGIGISAEALFACASKLPRVKIAQPSTVIGKNTVHSVQSGLVYGYASMVEGIIAKMKKEMNFPGRSSVGEKKDFPAVLATGGLASLISEACDCIDMIEPNLTLIGLSIIHQRNYRA